MAQPKAEPAAQALKHAPPDIATMRASAQRALTGSPAENELETLALTLRGHIEVLIPDVEAAAGREPRDSVPRNCALACIGEARGKLRIGDGQTLPARVAVAGKLARVVHALCDHYENITGGAPHARR